ncbi:MAG: adenylate cyclase [Candidatus Pacebacteria bacterium]|nr:adenylate cyclase [Candidatus Paceibacterota bacterium]
MIVEFERKFIPKDYSWQILIGHTEHIKQGYISQENGNSVYVYSNELEGDVQTCLYIEGNDSDFGRIEYEIQALEKDQGNKLFNLCPTKTLEIKRHHILNNQLEIEVDEFLGKLEKLFVITIILKHQHEEIELPGWIGKEVTDDPRYYNRKLVNIQKNI